MIPPKVLDWPDGLTQQWFASVPLGRGEDVDGTPALAKANLDRNATGSCRSCHDRVDHFLVDAIDVALKVAGQQYHFGSADRSRHVWSPNTPSCRRRRVRSLKRLYFG
jgi:hypothetical protein